MQLGLYPADEIGNTKIYSFGGLNRTRKGNRNEFSDMYNMSASEYPCFAPRSGRAVVAQTDTQINAVIAPDHTVTDAVSAITGVYNGGFYYNGELKSGKTKLPASYTWQIEQKGNTYIINGFNSDENKSHMFYYCIDTDEFGDGGKVMRNLIVTTGTASISTIYTDNYGIDDYSVTLPNGDVIRNRDFFVGYKQYMSYDTQGYTTLGSETNIFEQFFSVGDEIMLEGFASSGNSGQIWDIQSQVVVPQKSINAYRNNTIDTDNMMSTESLTKNDIVRVVVTGFGIRNMTNAKNYHEMRVKSYNKNGEEIHMRDLKTDGFYCSGITIKKKAKALNNMTVHHGRIWGTAPNGNQIFASPSDDIFSMSADDFVKGYGVRIPSDMPGKFTAICSYNNDLVAFKKDSITIISGTNPINYSSAVINGIGCISPRSVAATPNGIIFLSYNGFYIYNGSIPQCISTKLNCSYTSAVAGFDGVSYYASAIKPDGECELLVYNTRYGTWYKEDDISAVGFFRFCNDFYVCSDTILYKMDDAVPGDWSFTFMRTHDNKLDNKGINEIWVRADVSENAEFRLETASGAEFKVHSKHTEPGLRIYRTPVRFESGDSYQVRVCGTGKVVFYEFEIRKPEGGRRYKDYV